MGTYPVYVVDLSSHNDIESFAAMKAAGVIGVILKSTQGIHYVDKTYNQRKADALAAGLLVGTYHFADASDPIAQAKHFLANSDWDENTLFAHDWEDPPRVGGPEQRSQPMSVENGKLFLEYIYQVTGQRPVIYSGHTAKRELGDKKDAYYGQHRLWLASYTNEFQLQPSWDEYWIVQFTGDNLGPNLPRRIDGVRGAGIDLNTGDSQKIAALWTGGRPNNPNTGELPETKPEPSFGVDDALVGMGGVSVLTQVDLLTGIVVVGIIVASFVWWKYYRKSS